MITPSTATSPGTAQAGKEALKPPRRNAGTQSLLLSREEPFGITLIIGGTNVRFCVSHHASKEPLTNVVTWAQLKQNLEAERPKGYKSFETAHPFVYPKIVDEFVKFLEKQFDLKKGPLPIENLCAFNISIAGLVNGDERRQPGFLRPVNGIGAEVTTTNTGLRFAQTQIGRDLYSAFKARIPGMQLSPDNVFVLNDARAGQEGERILLGIPADKRVFFEIGGTGEGSQYDIPGFDEIGHRIIADSIQRKFLYIAGEQLADYIDPDGSFKVLERMRSTS